MCVCRHHQPTRRPCPQLMMWARWLGTFSSRAPRRTLAVTALIGLLSVIVAARAPSQLSSRGTEFYGGGTQSYATTQEIEAAISPRGGLPNLEVIYPVIYQQHVVTAIQQVATTQPQPFYSRNGRSAALLATIHSNLPAGPTAAHLAQQFREFPSVTVGGSAIFHQQFIEQIKSDLTRAELIAFPILLVLAFIVFRSAIAAVLPIIIGGLTLSLTLCGLVIVNLIHPVSILALDVVAGLALGLSLDYSLLLVARYREELLRGLTPSAATSRTLVTAGRTVTISSLTVTTAFASPLVFPIGVLRSLALGGALAALMAGTTSLLLLPSSCSLLGYRIHALTPFSGSRSPAHVMPPPAGGAWQRLARCVMTHPRAIALTTVIALLAMSAPGLRLRLTGFDAI